MQIQFRGMERDILIQNVESIEIYDLTFADIGKYFSGKSVRERIEDLKKVEIRFRAAGGKKKESFIIRRSDWEGAFKFSIFEH